MVSNLTKGILAIQDLRDSDDEEVIADIVISILLGKPFDRSKEKLDRAYDISSDLYEEISVAMIC